MELLELIGDKGVLRVNTTLGVEQEFFIIDRAHFALRPDLIMANRSLIGAPPPTRPAVGRSLLRWHP